MAAVCGGYQGPAERRIRQWLFAPQTSALGRLARAALISAPLALSAISGVSICPTALLLHLPCPGCGLTRASLALLRGQLGGAVHLNPLAPVLCPLLLGAALYAAARYVLTGRVRPYAWRADVILVGSMLALTAVWILRWFGAFGGPVPV